MKQKHSSKFRKIFSPFSKASSVTFRIVLSILIILCICTEVFFSVVFLSRIIPKLGIIVTAFSTTILAIPLGILLAPAIKAASDLDEDSKNKTIREQNNTIEELENEIESQKEKELSLKEKVRMLENITMNLQTYENVFKICFRDNNLTQTLKLQESLNQKEFSSIIGKLTNQPRENYDEVIAIMDCTVEYQSGIDLKNIRIAKINEDTILVSGIRAEYISKPRFEYNDFFTEVRHVKLDKNGEKKKIEILTDNHAARMLKEKQATCKANYEEAFINGKKDTLEEKEIIKKAQDFIKAIFQGVYKRIDFDNDAIPLAESLPILDFLEKEKEECTPPLSLPSPRGMTNLDTERGD